MPRFLATSLIVALSLATPQSLWAADQAPGPQATAGSAADTEKAIAEYRDAMQAKRADIMAKALTLSADQAAKFWPMFEKYQKEQNLIIDAQVRSTQKYAASYDKLTDADAVAYVRGLLERDAKMEALRTKWLETFQTAVSPGTAARAIQVDRRLSLLAQAQLSTQIPLVH